MGGGQEEEEEAEAGRVAAEGVCIPAQQGATQPQIWPDPEIPAQQASVSGRSLSSRLADAEHRLTAAHSARSDGGQLPVHRSCRRVRIPDRSA
eukprot:1029877-Prorocentrum_lima.AAC.1